MQVGGTRHRNPPFSPLGIRQKTHNVTAALGFYGAHHQPLLPSFSFYYPLCLYFICLTSFVCGGPFSQLAVVRQGRRLVSCKLRLKAGFVKGPDNAQNKEIVCFP